MSENMAEKEVNSSRKRELAATASAAVVSVVLSVAANVLIAKLSQRVRNQIAPEADNN